MKKKQNKMRASFWGASTISTISVYEKKIIQWFQHTVGEFAAYLIVLWKSIIYESVSQGANTNVSCYSGTKSANDFREFPLMPKKKKFRANIMNIWRFPAKRCRDVPVTQTEFAIFNRFDYLLIMIANNFIINKKKFKSFAR